LGRIALVLLLVGNGIVGATPVAATTGVAIDVARITIPEALAPGGTYNLPTFGVRNPGTEATSYKMTVSYVDGEEAARPPESWFGFTPAQLTLEPGQSQPVQTQLAVPPDAVAGDYSALIGPQIVTPGEGAQVGAGAAARLTFIVGACEGFDCWLRSALGWLQANPWLLVLLIILIVLAALLILRRRFSITISRRA